MKLSLTGEPLSWNDLTTSANLSIIGHYLSYSHMAIILFFTTICLLAYYINPAKKTNNRLYLHHFAAFALITPIVAFSYIDIFNKNLDSFIAHTSNKIGFQYMMWDWVGNVKSNGLPMHLVQTSRRKIPATPSETDKAFFNALKKETLNDNKRPKNIIVILLEGAWHDDSSFKELFVDFEKIGLKKFRAISPVYGGGTVNASFELLTGLPSRGVLHGIIYQEYASLISSSAHTYPRYLTGAGFKTVALHNFNREFWKRDVINPKFGFDKFIGLEDMGNEKFTGWPDDSILYNSALKELVSNEYPKFLFLTTVHTHGGYQYNNDSGETDYKQRLSISIKRASDFISKVKELEPDSLIIVASDHKPSLNKFFYEKGVFEKDQFASMGAVDGDFSFSPAASRELIGDVPAYIYYSDPNKVNSFIEMADNKPYFCVAKILDYKFTQIGLPAFEYAESNGICSDANYKGYDTAVSQYPEWLYYLSLFIKQ
jgi:phosphoglycerol transferase MdoB-like AlkP superfamily enzyme